MSLKHIKFDESPTMRSLEKVARDKGWIKDEPILKTASVQEDLSISNNLTENILKLCSGLRSSGLEKYADEIQNNFMNYKTAQTLYETSKETGEDLVDAAHPEGSHKLEGVDSSEALVETIIDNQLKHIKVIEKKPTGKLSSSKQILNAVRIVLADKNIVKITLARDLNKIIKNLTDVINIMQTIYDIVSENFTGGFLGFDKDELFELINKAIKESNTPYLISLLSNIRIKINRLYDMYKPSFLKNIANSKYEEIWKEIGPKFETVRTLLSESMALSEIATTDVPVQKPNNKQKFIESIKSIKNNISRLIRLVPIKLKTQAQADANKYLKAWSDQLDILNDYIAEMSDEELTTKVQELSGKISTLKVSIDKFAKEWLRE